MTEQEKAKIRHDFDLQYQIVKRAQAMGIAQGEQITQMMDIENAHKQYDLRLDLFLEADAADFAHDFIGIQNHMNRAIGKLEDFFIPRFAGCYHPVKEAN